MKKTMVVLMMIVSVFAFGSAFAAGNAAVQETSGMLYNGITVFDIGLASRSGGASAAEKGPEMALYNGITYFDQGQPVSEAKGSGAGGLQQDGSANKPYNGITVF